MCDNDFQSKLVLTVTFSMNTEHTLRVYTESDNMVVFKPRDIVSPEKVIVFVELVTVGVGL